ncbi:MAG TPA: hypothetical protein VLX68_05300 [Chitinivibrionales bacterium]|nr:hypothetical protein [Chitinivibrionales bacterium]
MNRRKSTSSGSTKKEKGRQVFGANADEMLAKKIIAHSKESAGGGKAGKQVHGAAPKEAETPKPEFTYRTPEEKRRSKTAGYGIAALACLFVLGIISFLWAKLKKD